MTEKKMTYNGHLSIARLTGSAKGEYIQVNVYDREKGETILVDVSLAEFAKAVTGRARVACFIRKITG